MVLDLSLGPNGDIAILTASPPHIRIAGHGESPVRAFGWSGDGPGEISGMFGIAALADGGVAVAGRNLVGFTPEGEYAGAIETDLETVSPVMRRFIDSSPSGRWLISFEDGIWPNRSVQIRVTDSEMRGATRSIAVPDTWLIGPEGIDLFSIGHAISDSGSVAIGSGRDSYMIQIIHPNGDTVFGGRDIERVRRSNAEIARLKAERDRVLGRASRPVRREVAHFGINSLRFDGSGRLWVHTPRGGDRMTVFDVFTDQLDYLGEVRAPERMWYFDIGDGLLTGMVRGEFDVPIVKTWRVHDPP